MTYEYETKVDLDAVGLNLMGEKGWELVSVIYKSNYGEIKFYFKKSPSTC